MDAGVVGEDISFWGHIAHIFVTTMGDGYIHKLKAELKEPCEKW